MPTPVLGLDCKIYRNTGSYAVPTWTEVSNIKDATLNLDKAKSDATTRAGNGWKQDVATLKEASVDFQMLWSSGDSGFDAVQDSFINDTTLDMLILDGAVGTSGSQGLRADMQCFTFKRNEALAEVVTTDVSLAPTASDNAPYWYETP